MIFNGHDHGDAAVNGFARNGATDPPPSAVSEQPDVVAQRAELERELQAVQAEVVESRRRVAARDAALKAALRDELMASRDRLAAMEAEHLRAVDAVRVAAERQVEQIVADAQREIGDLS